jgi:hypothetical protein
MAERWGGKRTGAGRQLGSRNKKHPSDGECGDHPGWGGRRAGAGRKPKLLRQAAALATIVPKNPPDRTDATGSV